MTNFKPIRTRIGEEDDLLCVKFDQGWLFGRMVARGLPRFYKHYSGVGVIDVSSARNVDGARLTLTVSGQAIDILYLDTDKPLFYHGALGVFPSNIQGIIRMPEEKTALGKFQNLPTQVGFTGSASTRYYTFDGEMSPYETPTEAAEMIIPPKMRVNFEWYNPGTYDAEPTLHLLFWLLELQIFKPTPQASYENLLIKLIAQKRIRALFRTCGDILAPAALDQSLLQAWGNGQQDPLKLITLDQATKLKAPSGAVRSGGY